MLKIVNDEICIVNSDNSNTRFRLQKGLIYIFVKFHLTEKDVCAVIHTGRLLGDTANGVMIDVSGLASRKTREIFLTDIDMIWLYRTDMAMGTTLEAQASTKGHFFTPLYENKSDNVKAWMVTNYVKLIREKWQLQVYQKFNFDILPGLPEKEPRTKMVTNKAGTKSFYVHESDGSADCAEDKDWRE